MCETTLWVNSKLRQSFTSTCIVTSNECKWYVNSKICSILNSWKTKELGNEFLPKNIQLSQLLTDLKSISSCCSVTISARRAAICLEALSWLAITLFLMFLARFAYFRVLSVSTKSLSDGDMQAIIKVRLQKNNKFINNMLKKIELISRFWINSDAKVICKEL